MNPRPDPEEVNLRAHRSSCLALLALLFLSWQPAVSRAGHADVTAVMVRCKEPRTCRFDVTVKHTDEGWKHYADRWEILGPEGKVLATRVLRHPHVEEQPFTRSLSGVEIPAGTTQVIVRAHDSIHAYDGKEFLAEIPR